LSPRFHDRPQRRPATAADAPSIRAGGPLAEVRRLSPCDHLRLGRYHLPPRCRRSPDPSRGPFSSSNRLNELEALLGPRARTSLLLTATVKVGAAPRRLPRAGRECLRGKVAGFLAPADGRLPRRVPSSRAATLGHHDQCRSTRAGRRPAIAFAARRPAGQPNSASLAPQVVYACRCRTPPICAAARLRVLVLEPGCRISLRPRLPRERALAAWRPPPLRHHPEFVLRKSTARSRRRPAAWEIHEVAMLQRPRKEHTQPGSCFRAPQKENVNRQADDHGARIEPERKAFEQSCTPLLSSISLPK